MGDGAQEFVGMPFFLQRVVLGTGPDDRDPSGLDLPLLPTPRRDDQLAFDRNRRAGAEILCFGIVADSGVHDDLDVSEAGPIVKLKE